MCVNLGAEVGLSSWSGWNWGNSLDGCWYVGRRVSPLLLFFFDDWHLKVLFDESSVLVVVIAVSVVLQFHWKVWSLLNVIGGEGWEKSIGSACCIGIEVERKLLWRVCLLLLMHSNKSSGRCSAICVYWDILRSHDCSSYCCWWRYSSVVLLNKTRDVHCVKGLD